MPKTLDVFLEDVDAGGVRTYLRTAAGYTVNPGQDGRRRLRLVVRPRTEGALQITDMTVTANRAGTAIGYMVSRDAAVTVEVVSPAGKRLKVVAEKQQAVAQTRATSVWDGTRQDGVRLPAGLYLLHITATTPEGQATRVVRPLVLTR